MTAVREQEDLVQSQRTLAAKVEQLQAKAATMTLKLR
jgi:hypothetical protein